MLRKFGSFTDANHTWLKKIINKIVSKSITVLDMKVKEQSHHNADIITHWTDLADTWITGSRSIFFPTNMVARGVQSFYILEGAADLLIEQ